MSEGKFLNIVRGTARGSLILIAGQLITGIISTVTIIWLARVLGPTAYGDYTLALLPVSIGLLFQDLGMHQSLMRYSAMYRFEKRGELKQVIWTGLIFSVATSLIITGVLYIFAGEISSSLLNRPELETLVRVSAFAVLGNGGLQLTFGAIFIGFELMGLKSLLLIAFSILRGMLGVTLIFLGTGTYGAVVSYSAALILSGVIGFILFLRFVKFDIEQKGFFSFSTLKTLISYGFPISINAILNGALSQYFNYLLAIYVATDLIGNYGASQNFGVIITFFTVPIQSSLLPLFSKFSRDDPRLKTIFNLSVKYTTMITLPIVLLLIVLASPISHIVYGVNYTYVPLFLSLYLIVYIFEGLGGITLTNLLLGIGETRVILTTGIISIIIGVPLAYFLISRYQVVGLLIVTIVVPRFGWLYQLLWVRKRVNISVDIKSSASLYLSAFTAFIITYVLVNYTSIDNWGKVIIGGVLFTTIYGLGLLLTGSLRRQDLEQFSETTKSLGPISTMIQKMLKILTKFAKD